MPNENQSLSQRSDYIVALDNYNDAKEQYAWAKERMNKILNKFQDKQIQEEALKCLKMAEETLLLTTQSLNRFKTQFPESLKTSEKETEFLNSKQVWK